MIPEELFGKYSPMVYNLALRLSGNPRDAQEIARDAFRRAEKAGADLTDEREAGAGLYRAAFAVWRERARRGKKCFLRNIFAPGSEDQPGTREDFPGSNAFAAPGEPGEKQALENALRPLDPQDKAMLLLRETGLLSYREISEIAEKPLGAVKSGIARTREALRARLLNAPREER